MGDDNVEIATWLKANGIDGDAAAALAVSSALDRPGRYGTLTVAYEGDAIVVSGPAGQLALSGSLDIQALRMRLEEIISHPGRQSISMG